MFDDSQSDQKDENQMSGVDSVASSSSDSGMGSGAITDPTDTNNDPSSPTLVHPSTPPQEDTPSVPDSEPEDNSPAPTLGGNSDNSDLAKLKSQALEQLSPLVNKLDQNPEEKYKTLMMMIQASDNQELLSEAYQAAQKITDEKAKAEALLNIVNEINYFTQQSNS